MTVGFYGGKFLPLHMGHILCIIKASTICDELYVGISHSEMRDRELCNGKMPYIPLSKRIEWLQSIASNHANVKVFEFSDDDGIDYSSWEEGATQVKKFINKPIDFVFGSEESYSDIFNKLYPMSQYVLVDETRDIFNISATDIREDGAFKYWDFIPNICKPYFNKKVVIVGTESCGKSTLVRNLALYFNTEYVEEFGRLMCEELNTGQPNKEYYPYIAYGHKMLEYQKNKTANKVLFIDTEAAVTQFYSQLYANESFPLLKEMAKLQVYDLWLFLEPDVDWVDDGLRIHGSNDIRKVNNDSLKSILNELGINYTIVSGNYYERFEKSINHINKIIQL